MTSNTGPSPAYVPGESGTWAKSPPVSARRLVSVFVRDEPLVRDDEPLRVEVRPQAPHCHLTRCAGHATKRIEQLERAVKQGPARGPNMSRVRTVVSTTILLALLFAVLPARAQLGSGSLLGTVTDGAGHPLGGARVTLLGVGQPRSLLSDATGRVVVLDLAPGLYEARVEVAGFAPLQHKGLAVVVGRPTAVQFQMSAVPGEAITVTAEPPTLAASGFSPSMHWQRRELEEIPTSRDPWSLAALTPGVLAGGLNSGGSESGQQMFLVGPGTAEVDNTFVLDGVVVTDLSIGGLSTLYYDFDQFESVAISTGTNDPRVGLGGIVLNMETRRAASQWRGSTRYLLADGAWQAHAPAERESDVPLSRLGEIGEWGLETGGPLVPERLWVWGAYGSSDIERFATGGVPTRIDIENAALKLDTQIDDATSLGLVLHHAERVWDGRGASPERSFESTWLQSGPLEVGKLEATRVFGDDVVVTGGVSTVRADVKLWPRGGVAGDPYIGADGVWHGGFRADRMECDMPAARLDARWLLDRDGVGHQLLFGAGARRFEQSSLKQWGPHDLYSVAPGASGYEVALVQAFRRARQTERARMEEAWLQDSVRYGRVTLGLGARYERQHGGLGELRADAHPIFPEVLPAIDVADRDAEFSWQQVTPRIGFTLALDRDGRTVLRGGYARFGSQLSAALVSRTAAIAASALFSFEDLDGDGVFDAGEPTQLLSTRGVDPLHPTVARPNLTDPALHPEGNHSYDLGLDRELAAGWHAGLDLRYRRTQDVFETRSLVRDAAGAVRPARRSDYRLDSIYQGNLPDGRAFSAPLYSLDPGLKSTGGTLLTNGDRERVYRGATLRVERRLDERWMLRAHLTVSDWRWRLGPEFRLYDDPTDAAPGLDAEGLWDLADGADDPVAEETGTSSVFGATSFPNSRWTFAVSSMVRIAPQRPWGFNVAASVTGREGFLLPYDVVLLAADGRKLAVQATPRADSFRYPDVYQVDLRLEHEVRRGDFRAAVGLDVFNLFNETPALLRQRELNSATGNVLLEAVGARTLRLGVRLGMR